MGFCCSTNARWLFDSKKDEDQWPLRRSRHEGRCKGGTHSCIVTGDPTTHSVAGVNARWGELEFSEGRRWKSILRRKNPHSGRKEVGRGREGQKRAEDTLLAALNKKTEIEREQAPQGANVMSTGHCFWGKGLQTHHNQSCCVQRAALWGNEAQLPGGLLGGCCQWPQSSAHYLSQAHHCTQKLFNIWKTNYTRVRLSRRIKVQLYTKKKST